MGRKVRIVSSASLEAAQLLYLFCRSLTTGDVGTYANPVEMAESIDSRILELRERLEMDLIHLGEEHHDGIRRKKEQHATEVRTASVNRKCSLGEPLQGQPEKPSSSLNYELGNVAAEQKTPLRAIVRSMQDN